MSRLAKNAIPVPSNVQATWDGLVFSVKGPLGEIKKELKGEVTIEVTPEGVKLTLPKVNPDIKALWGTYASHIKNMIAGVLKPYEKKLFVEGVGYRVALSGTELQMSLGFSHPVKMPVPEGLKVVVDKNAISISGIDKEKVGEFAAAIRAKKKPEPYKGKGIRYDGEVVRRKQGKKAA